MIRSGVLLAIGLAACGGAAAASIGLQSHLAVYDLTLKRAREGGGIGAVSGRLAMEWAEECDGYILNQRMLTRIVSTGGENVLNDFYVSTWESRDGLRFRYTSRSQVDGRVSEEVAGDAELERPGGPGVARFAKPAGAQLALPAGTVFPTEQMVLLLAAAARGESGQELLLFDGSRPDGLFDTYSVIGAERPPLTAAEAAPHELLSGQRSWPMHTAYFAREPSPEQPGTPEFEVAFRLFQNGIATEILLDYGNFAMNAKLASLKPLPKPEC